MDILSLVTLILFLISGGALIWLAIRAFRTHSGWGLAVLLLSPFSATIFGVKYWEQQKKPFLMYISTTVAAFGLSIYLFTASGGVDMLRHTASIQQEIMEQILLEQNADGFIKAGYAADNPPAVEDSSTPDPGMEEADSLDSETVAEAADSEAQVETETETETETEAAITDEKPVRYRLAYVPIRLADTGDYIGKTAKITRRNVPEKEYRITGSTPRYLELAQRSVGGQYSFRFKKSNIDRIRVLINEPY